MILLWCASPPQHIAGQCHCTGSSAVMIGLGFIPVSSLFFFISLVFTLVAESTRKFALAQSGHSAYSELRLTDSSERGIKLLHFSWEKDKAEEYMWRGEG